MNDPAPPPSGLLVLGLGNPILGDDAAGLLALADLGRRLRAAPPPALPVTLKEWSSGNLDLLSEISGFAALLLIDAFHSENVRPGRVRLLEPTRLRADPDTPLSPHLYDLPSALDLGERLGYPLPELLGAVIIEVGPECREFGETVSPAVAGAVPEAGRLALAQIQAYAAR